MPKQTFFNLPEEKKQRLLQAGFDEFSRVPADEASISNIIKLAEIPRGSFYQYFEDKFDLHAYLLEQRTKYLQNLWVKLLRENDGDLFAALPVFFERFLDEIVDEHQVNFWKNTFSSFRSAALTRKKVIARQNKQPNLVHNRGDIFKKEINFDLLKIDFSDETFELLRRQIITMMMQSINQYFFSQKLGEDNPRQKALDQFDILIDWLGNGIRR